MRPQTAFLNTDDPVAMHLIMETAMVDSKKFEVLPLEELEELKREHLSLQPRIEATKRKLALEKKLRDAAKSLNRLYSPKEEPSKDGSPKSPKRSRRSFLGSRSGSTEVLTRTDDEFTASHHKCERLIEELSSLEKQSEGLSRRILEHTAGILQLTHKGLKKTADDDGALPRSPESMASMNHRSMAHLDGLYDFDDRSLYRSIDQSQAQQNGNSGKFDLQILEQTEQHLDEVNNRIRGMVIQADPDLQLDYPPQRSGNSAVQPPGSQIQAHLDFLEQALECVEAAQSRTVQDAQRSVYDSEDKMEDINLRLHEMLQKTHFAGQSPTGAAPDSRGKSLQSQLSFSTMVLDRLSQRIEHLVEQKEILSRQVQQQRELNSKSDSERESQLLELTKDLSNAKRGIVKHKKEAKTAEDHVRELTAQLKLSKQNSADKKLLQAEKEANERAEETLSTERAVREEVEAALKSEKAAKDNLEAILKSAKAAKTRVEEVLDIETAAREKTEQTVKIEKMAKEKMEETLKLEKAAKTRAEGKARQLEELLRTEETTRTSVEDTVKQLQATLKVEKGSRKQAEDGLSKLQSTLKHGTDAQRQFNETITQLRASLDLEKEARHQAEENVAKEKKAKLEIKQQADSSAAELRESIQQEKDVQRDVGDTLTQLQESLQVEKNASQELQARLTEVQGELDEAKIDKAQAEADVEKSRNEIIELEGAMVRAQTDLTVVRAELDGAYGTRAQRAADVTTNPTVQKEIDGLREQNVSLQNENDELKISGSGNAELESKVESLQKELKDTIDDYEQMTKASIEFEKDREQLEGSLDKVRERCEALEAELSDEKVKTLGMKSPGVNNGPGSPGQNTSTMTLKNEFKKMMRDTRADSLKTLRVRCSRPPPFSPLLSCCYTVASAMYGFKSS
jgi:hypothetical protein